MFFQIFYGGIIFIGYYLVHFEISPVSETLRIRNRNHIANTFCTLPHFPKCLKVQF